MRRDASDDGGDAEANDNQPLGLGSCELRGELALAFTMPWEKMGTRKGGAAAFDDDDVVPYCAIVVKK